jgi:hypothetical protein
MSQIGSLISGLWGDAGQNFVNEQGGADKVFGTKPDVAPFVPTDLSAETQRATEGNLANFDLVTSYLNKIAPGFTDTLNKGFENTLSELKGEIPADVSAEIMRSSAFKSLMGGFGGTPMGKALTARDLGLTSLNLTQLGNNSAQIWDKLAEEAYSPWTVGTSEQAAITADNNAGKQATDQFKFNIAAAPDPGALGIFNVDAALGQQMLSLGMGAIGGIGGGGGGGSAQAPVRAVPGYIYNSSTGQYTSNGSTQPADWRTNAISGAWSDRRLKRDWILCGTSESGINIYEFEYDKPEGCASIRFKGVMADEIQEICPGAVVEIHGYMVVDYSQIDVKMEALV